jgi:hypothetical protein
VTGTSIYQVGDSKSISATQDPSTGIRVLHSSMLLVHELSIVLFFHRIARQVGVGRQNLSSWHLTALFWGKTFKWHFLFSLSIIGEDVKIHSSFELWQRRVEVIAILSVKLRVLLKLGRHCENVCTVRIFVDLHERGSLISDNSVTPKSPPTPNMAAATSWSTGNVTANQPLVGFRLKRTD